jgi:hypothetical protein
MVCVSREWYCGLSSGVTTCVTVAKRRNSLLRVIREQSNSASCSPAHSKKGRFASSGNRRYLSSPAIPASKVETDFVKPTRAQAHTNGYQMRIRDNPS